MAPIQTTIRIYKKLKDLNCFCNLEHEIRFLTVAFKKLTNNQLCKYIGPETEAKYRKYFDFVSKYFTQSNNLTLVAYHVRLGRWYLTFSNSKSNILDEPSGIVQKYQCLTLFFFLI